MATQRWMVRELSDDHVNKGDTYRPKFRHTLIGLLCHPGHLPSLVSCGPVEYDNVLCINGVYEREGIMHLSALSQAMVNAEELRTLKETGEVVLTRTQGDPVLRLIKEAV